MMMMMGTTTTSNQNPNAFTPAQWEELEQQALIYKYMVSGVPVPSDLILSVRRSLYNNNNFGGSFPYSQLYQGGGYGRKMDLEPGRCRRTDGKKWRCSKEAFPDSKYCERHMHRGRNRSRKPVEFSNTSSSSSSSTVSVSSSPATAVSKSISHSHAYPPWISKPTLKDYRQLQGVKDLGEDERSPFFHLNDHHHHHHHHQNYSQFSFQSLKDGKKDEETQGHHCYIMGTDFIKPSADQETTKLDQTTTSKQPFHHFFSPPKSPNLSTQDLFQSKPRPYW